MYGTCKHVIVYFFCVCFCELNLHENGIRGQCWDEWHHKVRRHYAIITTTTMALTSLWVSWLQMSALYSTKPSHTLCKTRQRDMKTWVCLFISVCLDISVHVCIYIYIRLILQFLMCRSLFLLGYFLTGLPLDQCQNDTSKVTLYVHASARIYEYACVYVYVCAQAPGPLMTEDTTCLSARRPTKQCACHTIWFISPLVVVLASPSCA